MDATTASALLALAFYTVANHRTFFARIRVLEAANARCMRENASLSMRIGRLEGER